MTNTKLGFTLLHLGLFTQFTVEALYLFGLIGYWDSWLPLLLSGIVWGTGGLKLVMILVGVEEE